MRLNWERDEIILVCDLLAQNDWSWIGSDDERVIGLSNILRKTTAFYPDNEERDTNFRNPAGVSRKAQNILSERDDHLGAKTHTSHLDREVLADYLQQPDQMRHVAKLIRRAIATGTQPTGLDEVPEEEFAAREGKVLLTRHLRRERDPRLRRRKLAAVAREGRPLSCEACGFDFGKEYGPRGDGYIEVHHVVPLHAAGESETKLSDLALLCSNCHRVIHRSRDWIPVDELREIVRACRGGAE